jgi:hypothetical protein
MQQCLQNRKRRVFMFLPTAGVCGVGLQADGAVGVVQCRFAVGDKNYCLVFYVGVYVAYDFFFGFVVKR